MELTLCVVPLATLFTGAVGLEMMMYGIVERMVSQLGVANDLQIFVILRIGLKEDPIIILFIFQTNLGREKIF